MLNYEFLSFKDTSWKKIRIHCLMVGSRYTRSLFLCCGSLSEAHLGITNFANQRFFIRDKKQ